MLLDAGPGSTMLPVPAYSNPDLLPTPSTSVAGA